MKYLTGYTKTDGHVVLEKAVVKGINASLLVAGDLSASGEDPHAHVTGELKGIIANGFQKDFLDGVREYGVDYLQAYTFGATLSPVSESPLLGPGCEFGTGSAGILACEGNAYVWTSEASGMCIVRIFSLFGKNRISKCVSSEVGGDDVIKLSAGDVLIACPEFWTDNILYSVSESEDSFRILSELVSGGQIGGDGMFDRVLRELAGDGFKGCIAALAYV